MGLGRDANNDLSHCGYTAVQRGQARTRPISRRTSRRNAKQVVASWIQNQTARPSAQQPTPPANCAQHLAILQRVDRRRHRGCSHVKNLLARTPGRNETRHRHRQHSVEPFAASPRAARHVRVAVVRAFAAEHSEGLQSSSARRAICTGLAECNSQWPCLMHSAGGGLCLWTGGACCVARAFDQGKHFISEKHSSPRGIADLALQHVSKTDRRGATVVRRPTPQLSRTLSLNCDVQASVFSKCRLTAHSK